MIANRAQICKFAVGALVNRQNATKGMFAFVTTLVTRNFAQSGGIKLGSIKNIAIGKDAQAKFINPTLDRQHYDVAIIGGGSGGIAMAYVN